jgi:hypothetical protein
MGREETGGFQSITDEWGGEWVIPGSGGGGLSCPWARVWITYIHLQLKREKEECSIWNAILSHTFSKGPDLCLNFHLRDKIPKKIFLRLLRGWCSLFLNLYQVDKGQETLPTWGNFLSYFSPSGLIWTQGESHCQNYCPVQSRLLMEILLICQDQ